MSGWTAWALSSIVALGPSENAAEPPAPIAEANPVGVPKAAPKAADPKLVPGPAIDRRARRLFIASGVLMGVSLVGEMTGAIVSTTCSLGEPCTLGLTYSWGSDDAGSRYTLITTGPGSSYVISRALSIPLIWTSEGLLLAGAHAQALADARNNTTSRAPRRLGWALLGTGLALYVGTRLTRLGFALEGVCQDPRCVYAFDQTTLGFSRGLSFSGSALVLHRRTLRRVRLGVAPMASFGVALTGEF